RSRPPRSASGRPCARRDPTSPCSRSRPAPWLLLARRGAVYESRPATLAVMVEQSLARLATAVSRRRRAVVVAWVALLAAGGWFSLHQSDFLSGGGWEVPRSASVRATDVVQRDFPTVVTPVFTVFVHGGDVPRRLAKVRTLVAREPDVVAGRPLRRGDAALLPLTYTGKSSNAIDEATTLRH